MALVASFVEYFIEMFLFPKLKMFGFWHFLGLMITIAGQILRSAAMYQAGINFTHLIATDKKDEHKLVTDGVYRFVFLFFFVFFLFPCFFDFCFFGIVFFCEFAQ